MRTREAKKSRLLISAAALACLWCGGCGDDDKPVEPTFNPPATRPSAPLSSAPMSVASPATSPTVDAGGIAWVVPSGWERVPGERQMRFATFRRPNVPGEEIAVSQFPGEVGGVLANVNRWRGQVGLAPITEAQLSTELQPYDNGKLKGYTMRLRGEKQHMLAAIISDPAADRTWFVKATTTPTNADTLEADLNRFARSFGHGQAPGAP